MEIVKANDKVLFIQRAGVFLPVACLTSNGMSESIEMIPTTTRFSQGWETARPNLQQAQITFEGLALETLFNSSVDELNQATIFVNFSNFGDRFVLPSTAVVVFSFEFFFNGSLAFSTGIRLTNVSPAPAGQVTRGATFEQTMQNIIAFLQPFGLGTISTTANGLKFEMNELGNWSASTFAPPSNTDIDFVVQNQVISNPFQLVSYDRLKLIKRNKERITWRIRSINPFVGRFFDEGEGYISEISDDNAAGQDSAFSGSIMVWGAPRIVQNNLALSADALNLLEDGNDNLIEP